MKRKTVFLTLGLTAAVLAAFSFMILAQKRLNPYPPPGPVVPPNNVSGTNPFAALSQPQNYTASRVSSYNREGGPRDNYWIPTTGEEVTLAEIEGPGAITHIWTTFRGSGRDMIIRFYWEGNPYPSIEAPIGDFFGVAMGIDAVMESFPIQVSSEGRSRNCWWHMPFNKSAKITVSTTDSETNRNRDTEALYFYIDYRRFGKTLKDIRYFHAFFQETDPAPRGKNLTFLDIEGEGHFVGVVMGHRARTPGWFGEGDDIITVDGKVSFIGTGTEDYFCDAWGFRVFSNLFHGVPVLEGRSPGDRLSAYRFHFMDPIPFQKSFKFEIEHWPWISPLPNTGRDYYSSLCFWYQKGVHPSGPRLEQIISNDPWNIAKGRWHIESALEAENLGVAGFESMAGEHSRPEVKFEMPNLSGDRMILFDSGGEGYFDLFVPVEEKGTYTVKIYFVRAPDYGIVRIHVNGNPVGDPVDTFLRTDDLTRPIWPPKKFVFSSVNLKKGMNIFRFSVNKKNPESEGFKLGLDAVKLEMDS